MKKHEHAAKNELDTKPAHDEVAKKAYAIYEKEGRPQGHGEQKGSEAEGKTPHAGLSGFSETILDLAGTDRADSAPLAAAPEAGGAARSHSLSRRSMRLGHWIEMKSVMGASNALEELAKLMPSDAHKLMPDGSVKDVPLGELAVDDKVLIKPGEKIPADGVIVSGESSVDEAMLTGESTPVTTKTGENVIGGAINGEGSLTIEVKGTGKDSFLSQVIDLVKQAQESTSKTQDLANTAALWLTIVALGGGVITFFIWQVPMGQDFAFAIERTVTVMVIACPHALGLAVPLVVAVCTALAASNGLLIRNRVAFEGARKLQAVIFDKTGTLTEGRFGITETLVMDDDLDEDTLRTYAASVDAHSAHPIAKAIAAASKKKLPVEGFNSITGKGAEGRVEGKDIKVISPGYLRDQNIELADPRVEPLQAQGKTVVFVLVDGKLKGAIALADIVRPEAKQAIAALKALDIRCLMLTGDNKATAKWVSDPCRILTPNIWGSPLARPAWCSILAACSRWPPAREGGDLFQQPAARPRRGADSRNQRAHLPSRTGPGHHVHPGLVSGGLDRGAI